MNHRKLGLAAIHGQPVEHIPFIARMDLWYKFHHNRGTLPHPYENASLWNMQRDLGVGIFGLGTRDSVPLYRLEHRDVTVQRIEQDSDIITSFQTPYGTLSSRDVVSEEIKAAGIPALRVEFPFKSPKDYDALQFIIEHTEVVENLDEYGRFVESIGNDGIAVPSTGHLPAHQLMLNYMGYETFYYQLFENESKLLHLIEALTEQHRSILSVALECPADVIQVGGNYDEQMTPPPIFDRYFAPVYREVREKFDAAGKTFVVHGDGEMKILLERLMDCGVPVVEALTPYPMTSIDVASTRKLWKDRVTMWGSIASVILTTAFSEKEFEDYLQDLFASVAPGDRFILGFGDNVPTDAIWERILRVVQFWKEKGKYPLAI